MNDTDTAPESDTATLPEGGRMRMPRSRGAVTGTLLMLLGIWGAFVPFVGPYFHFAFTPKPNETWHWTAARGWFEVLPGGVAFLGGLLLVWSASRLLTSFGAWIAAVAGGWFVVGPTVSIVLTLGSVGQPSAAGDRRYVAEWLAFYTGLGALIILFAAIAVGRLSVRSVRDVRAAAERDAVPSFAEQEAADRAAFEREQFERAAADRAVTDRNAEAWAAREDAGPDEFGYGTPGTTTGAASAVTSELPAADAPYRPPAEEPVATEHDEQGTEREAPGSAAGGAADAAAVTAALPRPDDEPEPVPSAADTPEPTEPPLVLEPPAGHPDSQRSRRDEAPVEAEAAAPLAQTPRPETSGGPVSTWNPEAQSPTTTGELPAVKDDAAPGVEDAPPVPEDVPANSVDDAPPTSDHVPSEADADPADPATAPTSQPGDARRSTAQQPRRYFGAGMASPDDASATAQPATGPRDAVRTDEGIDQDIDHELDLDERSSR